ncbi:MAG: DUF2232 domain-containing protein [Alphaproteobacteria bacterium]|nr:DUF2232 domain-containing protein [Alphaproteobacteria bacterium]
MTRDFAIAAAGGLLSALLYLSAPWGLFGPLLALFSPFPLFAVGFGLGLTACALAVAAALLTAAVLGGLSGMLLFAVIYGVPALMIVRFALLSRPNAEGQTEWYPPGLLLTWIALYAAGAFVATAIFITGPDGLERAISQHIDSLREIFPRSGQDGAPIDQALAATKPLFPFLVATWWMAFTIVNGTLAQGVLERRGLALRPSPDLTTTALPHWFAGVMVAAIVVALLGSGWLSFLGGNVARILCVPYFLVGLAVVHSVSTAWPGRRAILFAVYLLLLLLGWIAVVVVAGLGFLDYWAGLRQRFGRPDRG